MRDLQSGFFFFCFSLFVLWASLQVGLGTLHKPGSGFLSFCVGVSLSVFSLILIYKGWSVRESPAAFSRRVVLATISTIVYSLVLDSLGFLVATFILLGVFFHLGKPRQWWLLCGMSGLVTFLVYLVFGILLQVSFPRGFLGM